jgi:UDP-N-acetylglucosamine 2-epimerase (non-hydrolysing)
MLVFGARPNLMKIAPLYREMLARTRITPVLVNTGQHSDELMSDVFIEALGLPRPDVHLQLGRSSPTQQFTQVIENLQPIIGSVRPDVCVVVGDRSATVAATIAAATAGVSVARVEAGLRSGNRSMPEERARVIIDRLADFLFTSVDQADENLVAEGMPVERIHRVGNVMIDALNWIMPRLPHCETRRRYGIPATRYGVVTLHRPENVDDPETLAGIIAGLELVGRRVPLVFPIDPRLRQRLVAAAIDFDTTVLHPVPPMSYPEFISVLSEARVVLTDSAGVQEEAGALGLPCLALRRVTERSTVPDCGLHELVGSTRDEIEVAAERVLAQGEWRRTRPPLWDGAAAHRIVDVLESHALSMGKPPGEGDRRGASEVGLIPAARSAGAERGLGAN